MKKISQEDWEKIHDRTDKIGAINALRRNIGYGLLQAKNAVEHIWSGRVRLEDICEKATPCSHCAGTGFA